jgi:hypothetical protein
MISLRVGLRALALTAVASVAVLPGPAGAETPSGPLPACAPGVLPTMQQACKLPACPAGVLPTREAPCAKSFAPGTTPGSQQGGQQGTFCPPLCPGAQAPGTSNTQGPNPGANGTGPGRGDAGGKGDDRGTPSLMGGFVSRVWRFAADADSYDAASNTLNVTVTKMVNLPKRFNAQDDSIIDRDADVIFTKKTKVYDDKGKRLRVENSYDAALDDAESVAVTGKITPPSKWNKDEDGTPVTTVRAKRVTITG